jgi:hypothetical protein
MGLEYDMYLAQKSKGSNQQVLSTGVALLKRRFNFIWLKYGRIQHETVE